MTHTSHSLEDTQRLAADQALMLVKTSPGESLVVALEGDLGAGKTTFAQAFAKALGVQERVKSPTFVLMKHYQLSDIPNYDIFYHLDCYRLQSSADLEPLGLKEIFKNPQAIVIIEWAELVADILPPGHWLVRIEHAGESERKISIIKK